MAVPRAYVATNYEFHLTSPSRIRAFATVELAVEHAAENGHEARFIDEYVLSPDQVPLLKAGQAVSVSIGQVPIKTLSKDNGDF